MDKRGEGTPLPDTLLGLILELAKILLIVGPVLLIILAIVQPSTTDQRTLHHFEDFVAEIERLVKDPDPYAGKESHPYDIGDEYTVVGFNKGDDYPVFETCDIPLERIEKPALCTDKACLCLYQEDTDALNWRNTDFNGALESGNNRFVVCRPLKNVDYIFSHPYALIKNEDYCNDNAAYANVLREVGLFSNGFGDSNTRNCDNFDDLDKSYSQAFNAEGQTHDGDYYAITSYYDDFLRNMRGFLWQGPQGFDHYKFDFTYETRNGERTISPTAGAVQTKIKEKLVPEQLHYFERLQERYAWCKVFQPEDNAAACNEQYAKTTRETTERFGTVVDARESAIDESDSLFLDEYDNRYLHGIYSSFVLYGQCDEDDQSSDGNKDKGTAPTVTLSGDLDDNEWGLGLLYLEKYTDPVTEKTGVFIGVPSPYTQDRTKVLKFFNDKSLAASNFKGLAFNLPQDGRFVTHLVKKDEEFVVENYDKNGASVKGKILEIATSPKKTITLNLGRNKYEVEQAGKRQYYGEDGSQTYTYLINDHNVQFAFYVRDNDKVVLTMSNHVREDIRLYEHPFGHTENNGGDPDLEKVSDGYFDPATFNLLSDGSFEMQKVKVGQKLVINNYDGEGNTLDGVLMFAWTDKDDPNAEENAEKQIIIPTKVIKLRLGETITDLRQSKTGEYGSDGSSFKTLEVYGNKRSRFFFYVEDPRTVYLAFTSKYDENFEHPFGHEKGGEGGSPAKPLFQ